MIDLRNYIQLLQFMLRVIVSRRVYNPLLTRCSSSAPSSTLPPSYSQLQAKSPAVSSAGPVSPNVIPQAPNSVAPWSTSQRLRPAPGSDPRFEQTVMDLQPAPLSAMELINNEPIRLVENRRAVCDGGLCSQFVVFCLVLLHNNSTGGGPLGHPKIFINLVSECVI